jgi:hypothetical protein
MLSVSGTNFFLGCKNAIELFFSQKTPSGLKLRVLEPSADVVWSGGVTRRPIEYRSIPASCHISRGELRRMSLFFYFFFFLQ